LVFFLLCIENRILFR